MPFETPQLTDSQRFSARIARVKNLVRDEHRSVFLFLWENENPEAILRGQGTEAKAIFDLSVAMQTISKTADPSYEILTPYLYEDREVTLQQGTREVPDLDVEGNEQFDEQGNVKMKSIAIEKIVTMPVKVPVQCTFHSDGSLNQIIKLS